MVLMHTNMCSYMVPEGMYQQCWSDIVHMYNYTLCPLNNKLPHFLNVLNVNALLIGLKGPLHQTCDVEFCSPNTREVQEYRFLPLCRVPSTLYIFEVQLWL